MSRDKEWSDLYEYVQKLLGYNYDFAMPKEFLLRLRGLSEGKFIANNNIDSKAKYSFEVIRYTFMVCSQEIKNALKNNKFQNETHKFNYILKIVEKNIDDVNNRVSKRSSNTVV